MTTLLLLIIYIAFISLGIPDSLFGTAWPAIYSELTLPISYGSFVTIIISCGTIISSLLSSRLLARFGTGFICIFSTALTAIALLLFSFSNNFYLLCVCALPLGLGAGAIDIALNNYVALHYSAIHMSFLLFLRCRCIGQPIYLIKNYWITRKLAHRVPNCRQYSICNSIIIDSHNNPLEQN